MKLISLIFYRALSLLLKQADEVVPVVQHVPNRPSSLRCVQRPVLGVVCTLLVHGLIGNLSL